MTQGIFIITALCWGYLAAFFAMRFARRRRAESLVIAAACLGWPLLMARELHYLARFPTTVFISAGLVFGLLGVLVVFHFGSQRP